MTSTYMFGGKKYVLLQLAKKAKATQSKMSLPADSAERKCIPITSGVLDYFPLAIAEVAKASVLLTDTTFSADLTESYGFLC